MTDQSQPVPNQSQPNDSSAGSVSSGDDVMNIITGVQAELDRLKSAQEQQTSDRAALEDLHRELDEREQRLAERDSQIDERQASLAEQEQELARKENELNTTQHDCERAAGEVAQREQEIDSKQAELHQQEEALQARHAELSEEQALLGVRREEMGATAAALAEESASLTQRQSRLQEHEQAFEESQSARRQELDDRERELAALHTGVEQADRDAQRLKEELEQRLEKLKADQNEVECELDRLQTQRHVLVDTQTRLDDALTNADEHIRRLAELESERELLQNQLDESQSQREQLDEAASQREQLVNQIADSTPRLEQLQTDLDAACQQSAALQKQLDDSALHCEQVDHQLDEAVSQRMQLQTERDEARQQYMSLQDELAGASLQREQFELQLGEMASERDQLQIELDRVRGDSVALQELLDEQTESAVDPEKVTSLESTVASLEDQLAGLKNTATELGAQLAQRDETVEAIVEERADFQGQVQSLRAELEQSHDQLDEQASCSSSPATALRRDRLGRVRQELRRRTELIGQAKDAILAKSKEADHILEQRQAVAKAQIELDRRAKKLATRAERSRGMSVLFLGVIAILGLGVASWTVVSRVVPATYIASATLAADDSSGELTAAQVDAWREYCSNLSSDPRLMEIATDRMARRGILEFSNAATLASKMSNDLDLASPAPGQLTLSLTGSGADRTARILDTFVASLVSAANDVQGRRLDDASTIVMSNSTADSYPINDPRLLDTAIVWGASVAVVLLLALGLWAKLSVALRKFDQENQEMLAVGGRPL